MEARAKALAERPKAQWKEHMKEGGKSYHEGRYAEAEKSLQAALKEAERFGPEDQRVFLSLDKLAQLYHDQGKYSEAEPVYGRALAIVEKLLGPEHSRVATTLENYATLLQKTKRNAEAARMEARAKAIRAKHARENPTK